MGGTPFISVDSRIYAVIVQVENPLDLLVIWSFPVNTSNVKQQLEQLRDDLLERRARIAKHVERRDEPLPADFAEQAVALENEETIVELSDRLERELVDIERALKRLDDGQYNACTGCGEEIEEARLAALPTTTLCVSCAQHAG